MLKSTWRNFIENLLVYLEIYYISKLLVEVSPNKNKNSASTYSQTQKSKSY